MAVSSELVVECEHGLVRIFDETAIVEQGSSFTVWRGPFDVEIGRLFAVRGPRGIEYPASTGRVVSWFRLR
jgi:hypothetical protein